MAVLVYWIVNANIRLVEPIEVSTSTVLMHEPKQFAKNANASREKENTMKCQAWLLV